MIIVNYKYIKIIAKCQGRVKRQQLIEQLKHKNTRAIMFHIQHQK